MGSSEGPGLRRCRPHDLCLFLRAAEFGQLGSPGLLQPDRPGRARGGEFGPPALQLRRRHAELARDAGLGGARPGQASDGLLPEPGGGAVCSSGVPLSGKNATPSPGSAGKVNPVHFG